MLEGKKTLHLGVGEAVMGHPGHIRTEIEVSRMKVPSGGWGWQQATKQRTHDSLHKSLLSERER